jgi:phosphoketolase
VEKTYDFQLNAELQRQMNAYWRAANYLSVGQIYLLDNPLLTEPFEIFPILNPACWVIGYNAWFEFYSCAYQSTH